MRLLLISIVLLLTGCATRQADAPDSTASDLVGAVEAWQFKGRLAVRVEDDPDASGQLNILWQQADEISDVRLSGPFGAGAWQLRWEPERVSVVDADGERSIEYTGPDAAGEFMRRELGWAFPADGIRYWVRGLADPAGAAEVQRSSTGALQGLQQYGWDIAYDRFGEFDGLSLPTRFTIEGRGVRMRMAIGRWQFAPADEG